MGKVDGFISLVEGLLGYQQYLLVKRACEDAIQKGKYIDDPRTWKLLAVANGNLGHHDLAKSALKEALGLRYDENIVANLITACFASDNSVEALGLVEDHWEFFDETTKSNVSNAINEALRIGLITGMDIPSNALNDYVEFSFH